MSIQVTISRKALVAAQARREGLALYDTIAALQPATDARRDRRIKVANWTPLHSVWLYATHGGFARWLEERGVVPRANLSGADLSGAYRSATSPAIPGWRTLATGYLERDVAAADAAQ